ncbi:flagellar biosynthetic protein FliQ [Stieleria bergensis]
MTHIDADTAIEMCQQALLLAAMIAAPILIVGVLMGLLTGLLQSLFQIQDQAISFVPKLLASVMVLLVCLPWMFSQVMQFWQTMSGVEPY